MDLFNLLYRGLRKCYYILKNKVDFFCVLVTLRGNRVRYGKGFRCNGKPKVDVWPGGFMVVGNNFRINNGPNYNVIGRQQPCCFIVMNGANLCIKDNVGMSGTAIVCSTQIKIGNNVKIGGNTVIYDTDFHSLNANIRQDPKIDQVSAKKAPVTIGNNVFIGAHSTILKGVEIGNNSIIGSGSVVTKSIPANEIWGGNPAKFIRSLNIV